MKTLLKIAVLVTCLFMMLLADVPILLVELVPEAEAIFGVRRRSHRRGVVVGYTAGAATAATAAAASSSQQQAAAAQQQPATAQQPAAPAAPAAPPPAASGKPLPLGTVVAALPGGCIPTPVGGIEYYYCGGNFYRAVFQGNKLVYVTTKPE